MTSQRETEQFPFGLFYVNVRIISKSKLKISALKIKLIIGTTSKL